MKKNSWIYENKNSWIYENKIFWIYGKKILEYIWNKFLNIYEQKFFNIYMNKILQYKCSFWSWQKKFKTHVTSKVMTSFTFGIMAEGSGF